MSTDDTLDLTAECQRLRSEVELLKEANKAIAHAREVLLSERDRLLVEVKESENDYARGFTAGLRDALEHFETWLTLHPEMEHAARALKNFFEFNITLSEKVEKRASQSPAAGKPPGG